MRRSQRRNRPAEQIDDEVDEPASQHIRIVEPQRSIEFSDQVWIQAQYDQLCKIPGNRNDPECLAKRQIEQVPCEADPLTLDDIPAESRLQWYYKNFEYAS